VAVALLAACGGDNSGEVTASASRAARSEAQAEQYEWSAHLEGQARTHSKADSTDDAPAPADQTSGDELVSGSRHMPVR